MKTLLVDLSELKDIYRGLGQVALSYGNYFKDNYKRSEAPYKLTLLMPKELFGMFGNEVEYLNSKHPLRLFHQWYFPRFDTWHTTSQLSRFRPRSSKTKLILTIHDLNYLYETAGAQRNRKHRRLQNKVNNADKIVSISEFVRKEVLENLELNGKDCLMIYNGVSDVKLNPMVEPDMEIRKPFFFSIGVVQRKKNFHVLLDLMKLLPEKHLYLAGGYDTDYGRFIKGRIQEEAIDNITLLGPVSNDEKAWYFSNCEAFLFPSLFEGFGLPVIEAMQFGKPVFSSDKTSLKEIGGEFVYFWDNFDAEEMKLIIEENLDSFYSDENLIAEMVDYAYSFSYEKHFEQYERIYKEL